LIVVVNATTIGGTEWSCGGGGSKPFRPMARGRSTPADAPDNPGRKWDDVDRVIDWM
jgi:hypothetical protein